MTMYDYETADMSRGPGVGACPDGRAIRAAIHGATCGRCRTRPAVIARGAHASFAFRCAGCDADVPGSAPIGAPVVLDVENPMVSLRMWLEHAIALGWIDASA